MNMIAFIIVLHIVKAHSGEIKVVTKDGEGLPGEHKDGEFIISLPIV
jgi:hypothetical protein